MGREPDPPYNRPDCSKGYLRGKEEREEALFRPDEWWGEQDIELLTRTSVTALDAGARTAKLSNKQEIEFGKALLATGANVRRLNVDGCQLEQIHYLRTLGNADAIREGVEDAEKVVLIGGSYIGCEVAASLTHAGQALHDRDAGAAHARTRLRRSRSGRFFQELLEAHGVTIHGDDELERFEGEGRVAKVVTRERPGAAGRRGRDRRRRDARRRSSPSARACEIGERGGVRCTSRLETSAPGVFAAGDICEYESVVHGGAHVRIEHWDVAFNHGKTAALNMLGRDVAHDGGALLLLGARRLGRTGVRRAGVRVGRGDRARLARRRRVHQLVPEGRRGQGGADVRSLRRSRRGAAADRRGRTLDEAQRAALADVDADLSDCWMARASLAPRTLGRAREPAAAVVAAAAARRRSRGDSP